MQRLTNTDGTECTNKCSLAAEHSGPCKCDTHVPHTVVKPRKARTTYHTAKFADAEFYDAWRLLDIPTWTGENLWPEDLSEAQVKKLEHDYQAMPEEFYTRTGLPVITPTVVEKFLTLYEGQSFHWHELCSGSGRTSVGMYRAGLRVLFPIDFRYG